MGPRARARGNGAGHPHAHHVDRRFNGATSARSWKCPKRNRMPASPRASMGPRARARGNQASIGSHPLDPLALYFWGTTWSVAAWCESREDFRIFRLDRIRSLQMGGEKFDEVSGRTLEDFVESVSRERDQQASPGVGTRHA